MQQYIYSYRLLHRGGLHDQPHAEKAPDERNAIRWRTALFTCLLGRRMITVEAPPRVEPATPAPVRRKIRVSRNSLILLLLIVVIGYFTIGPIVYLVNGTFNGDTGFTLEFLRSAYLSPGIGDVIWTTVEYAVGSAIFAVILGSTLAFGVARTDAPAKSLMIASSLVPLIIPGVLHTIA